MIPIHFAHAQEPLFGIYTPAASPRRRLGIVILNPLGWEALRAHRSLRLLGVRLASAGIDVLRFDYSGTGDSADLSHGIPGVDRWLDDVDNAIEELSGLSGVQKISLLGLRFGGLLAAEYARRHPRRVNRVVLWDTPREGTTILSGEGMRGDGGGAAVFELTPEVAAEVSMLQRGSLPTFRGRVLYVQSAPEEPDGEGEEETLMMEGSPQCWIQDADFGAGAVPTHLIDGIVAWLSR